ncbi:MAG: hypothetical protein LUH21_04200 [Clostridiales bacterium]|nr:hypothetical protein [Clostridiales bacterium]
MQNTKILEMINNGKIEDLKAILRDEIYQKEVSTTLGAKQRYAAMKRYFKYNLGTVEERLQKPCRITYDDKEYYSFLDGYSFALTTESIGVLEEYDNSKGDYFDIRKLLPNNGRMNYVNLNEVMAEAKSAGYKYRKDELGQNEFHYLMHYNGGYYKIGILDQAYSIINNGEKAEVYYIDEKAPLVIKNSIGIVLLLPVRDLKQNGFEDKTVIDVLHAA